MSMPGRAIFSPAAREDGWPLVGIVYRQPPAMLSVPDEASRHPACGRSTVVLRHLYGAPHDVRRRRLKRRSRHEGRNGVRRS